MITNYSGLIGGKESIAKSPLMNGCRHADSLLSWVVTPIPPYQKTSKKAVSCALKVANKTLVDFEQAYINLLILNRDSPNPIVEVTPESDFNMARQARIQGLR